MLKRFFLCGMMAAALLFGLNISAKAAVANPSLGAAAGKARRSRPSTGFAGRVVAPGFRNMAGRSSSIRTCAAGGRPQARTATMCVAVAAIG